MITPAVFNAEQIDGIPALEQERTYDRDPVEQAEKLLRASGAEIEHSPTGGAYYRVSTDTIRLPSPDRFAEPSKYYGTALHELGHNADSRIMPLAFPVPRSARVNPITWSA